MTEIQVAAGIIRNDAGEVLLAQRAEPPVLCGLWEFPGGKIEDGESASDALIREIKEELDLDIRVERLFGIYIYPIGQRQLVLHIFLAVAAVRVFKVLDHLDARWVSKADFNNYELVPADQAVPQTFW